MSGSQSDDIDKSVLHLVAASGNLEQIRYLLQCGVDVDLMEEHSGNSPLHIATLSMCPMGGYRIKINLSSQPSWPS